VVARDDVFRWLSDVPDPEIPVLNLTDLGIIRDVELGDEVVVSVAPTYIGCPATEVIEQSVVDALHERGLKDVRIRRVLSPAWTTDWMTDEGRRKLKEYGIAPPAGSASKRALAGGPLAVACPRCDSINTERVSEFGSTACKAAYRCRDCLEPFEYFKCL